MINQPTVKLGIVGVSRDCFPITLTQARVAALMAEVKKAGLPEVYDCPVTIENEKDTMQALDWAKANGINAVCMFLGNFGPEGPTTMFVQKFQGPAMVLAAKEEGKEGLASDRGDALCGVLNFSYSVGLRRLKVYIPEYPNVSPAEAVKELADFFLILNSQFYTVLFHRYLHALLPYLRHNHRAALSCESGGAAHCLCTAERLAVGGEEVNLFRGVEAGDGDEAGGGLDDHTAGLGGVYAGVERARGC